MAKVIWLTGLSGSGKSTIAQELKKHILNSVILDGDFIRQGLCSDLGFTKCDRDENIRRISELAKLLYLTGITSIVAVISPLQTQRDYARELILNGDFIEVHVNAPINICEKRDVKGLYKKAKNNEIKDFTGISSLYEEPINPEITIDTSGKVSIDTNVNIILGYSRIISIKQPHHVFIGRWCPFHKGHFEIISTVYEEDKRPILILVRDTLTDLYPAEKRKKMIDESLLSTNIPYNVLIVPDICSVNYGREVGYKVRYIDVDNKIKKISSSDIRNKNDNWENKIMPGVSKLL